MVQFKVGDMPPFKRGDIVLVTCETFEDSQPAIVSLVEPGVIGVYWICHPLLERRCYGHKGADYKFWSDEFEYIRKIGHVDDID